MRSARVGECREIVATATPAGAAMSRTGTSTPEATKAAAAAPSRVFSLRRASDRFPGGGVPNLRAASATDQAPPHTRLSYGTLFRMVGSGTPFRLSDHRSSLD